MKLIICGGRDFTDQAFINEVLNLVHEKKGIELIIQGGARGADRLGKEWAVANNVRNVEVPADWDRHGKSAGYKRNAEMLAMLLHLKKKGDKVAVVAFPGGVGTNNMMVLAEKAGVDVFNIEK
jgi:hypothetical protein